MSDSEKRAGMISGMIGKEKKREAQDLIGEKGKRGAVKEMKKNILEQGEEYLSTRAQNRLLSGRLEREGKAPFQWKKPSMIERMRKFAEKKARQGKT